MGELKGKINKEEHINKQQTKATHITQKKDKTKDANTNKDDHAQSTKT